MEKVGRGRRRRAEGELILNSGMMFVIVGMGVEVVDGGVEVIVAVLGPGMVVVEVGLGVGVAVVVRIGVGDEEALAPIPAGLFNITTLLIICVGGNSGK